MRRIVLWVLLTLFCLPFAYLPALSLASGWRFPGLLPSGWTAGHWTDLGGGGDDWAENALRSLALATATGLLATGAGFLTARHLSGHPKRQLWLALAYLPFAFSPVIYAHCLKFFFNVSDLSGTFAGVLLAQFILTYPFAILLFFNHFDHSLRAMEDLTYTLGGSTRAAFWRVLVPVSRPALLICFFQTFLISWFEYGLTSVIGLGQVRTLTIAVYQYIGEANQYVAALASCLVCLPPLVLLWLNQRFVFRLQTT
ncbi:MAG: ABC transporter permease subunit [Lewinellaceae bacterium]|nr:ABC transporter permease subunit [Lewinellaceae bacterium]